MSHNLFWLQIAKNKSRSAPRPFQLLTWWTFLDSKASVALNVTQRRETQHGQPSVEHFSHGPQKLQTGKHLTKQVWPRLLEKRRRLLVSSFAFPCTTHPHLPFCCALTPKMCTRL